MGCQILTGVLGLQGKQELGRKRIFKETRNNTSFSVMRKRLPLPSQKLGAAGEQAHPRCRSSRGRSKIPLCIPSCCGEMPREGSFRGGLALGAVSVSPALGLVPSCSHPGPQWRFQRGGGDLGASRQSHIVVPVTLYPTEQELVKYFYRQVLLLNVCNWSG